MNNTLNLNFDLIIDEYSNYVFKIVDNIVGNSLSYQDKEEIVSDTFFLLWKNQDKIDNNLKAYLGAIARNSSYNKLRQNNTHFALEESTIVAYEQDFDEIIMLKEKLKKLKPEEMSIFNLYYVKGLKVSEIAKVLGKTNSDIKIKLYRMRKKLREED